MNELKYFTVEEKTNFIKHMFRYYQPTLNIIEQITLLTLWEEICVVQEEYEMAKIVKDEMDYIINNQDKVIQKLEPHLEPQKKENLFTRIKNWFILKLKF
jgi:hypothetical protein